MIIFISDECNEHCHPRSAKQGWRQNLAVQLLTVTFMWPEVSYPNQTLIKGRETPVYSKSATCNHALEGIVPPQKGNKITIGIAL